MKERLNLRIDKAIKAKLRKIADRNKRSIGKQIEMWVENNGTK